MNGIVHASTSLLRSSSQLTRLIDSFRGLSKDRLLLFSLSHNASNLEWSVSQLSSCTNESIGCISAPLPIKTEQPFFSCSVAVFDKDVCVPFSTLESGEGPAQVGRPHSYNNEWPGHGSDGFDRLNSNGEVNWNEIWNAKTSTQVLPQELKNVRDARTLVYFSDNSSWDLAMALHVHMPQAHQLGIMASPTPFVTGQPFTLLRNGKMQSSGAVGVAMRAAPLRNVLSFEGLIRLTHPLTIKRAEGNLIHELGDSLPARILLKAVQDSGVPDGLAKGVDYYIGIRDANTADETHPKLVRIVAGSPSRGSIAVEDVPAPPVGTAIEFYYRLKATPVRLPVGVMRRNTRGVDPLFGALVDNSEIGQVNILTPVQSEEPKSLPFKTYNSSFVTSSEYGFILGTGTLGKTRAPWKCTVPSTFGGFVLPMR